MKEYKNIPTFLDKEQISSDYKLKSSSISNNTTNTPNTVNTPVVNTHVYSTANQISYVTNNKESTTMITRTTKYSAKKAIEQMKKKIDDIKNGVYKNPKLKALEVDSSKNHPDNDDDDDDDDYIIGQY
jgi:stress response protein YsnF